MELKPGYKQTEVGVIPDDWEVCNLTDLSLKITDGDHLTPNREPSGYYLLSARNVLNGRIDVRDVDYVGHAEYQRMKQRCGPEAGDILISCSGTIGRVAVVPQGFECVLVRSAALAKIDKSLADGAFLQFWLQGKSAQSQISGSVNQGAQPNLFLNQIERLKCPKPPLSEQLSIAKALGNLDKLLSKLDQLITKKRQIKQAAMQELLTGKRRLPGFEGEWEVKRLGDVANFFKGKGLPKSALIADGAYPCIHYGELFTQYPETIEEIISRTNCSRDSFCSIANDVLMPTSDVTPRGLAKASCVTVDGVILGGDILVIRSDKKRVSGAFLSYIIRREEDQVLRLVTGSTVYHLYGSDMKKFTFVMPSLREQTAIATVLSKMDAEIAVLEQRQIKTRALKQGMMQQLLTGNIRLK